jgi:hypothetical protein
MASTEAGLAGFSGMVAFSFPASVMPIVHPT